MTLGTLDSRPTRATTARTLATITRGGRPVQPPDQPRGRPERRPLRLRRLRQRRVHRFSPTGELKQSWGGPGTGPGRVQPAARHLGARPTAASSCATARTTASRSSARTASTDRVDRHPAPDARRLRRDRAASTSPSWGGSRGRRRGLRARRRAPGPRQRLRPRRARARALGRHRIRARAGNFAAPHGIAVDSKGDLRCYEVRRNLGVGMCREGWRHLTQSFGL